MQLLLQKTCNSLSLFFVISLSCGPSFSSLIDNLFRRREQGEWDNPFQPEGEVSQDAEVCLCLYFLHLYFSHLSHAFLPGDCAAVEGRKALPGLSGCRPSCRCQVVYLNLNLNLYLLLYLSFSVPRAASTGALLPVLGSALHPALNTPLTTSPIPLRLL